MEPVQGHTVKHENLELDFPQLLPGLLAFNMVSQAVSPDVSSPVRAFTLSWIFCPVLG
jgi:hypothetical protein